MKRLRFQTFYLLSTIYCAMVTQTSWSRTYFSTDKGIYLSLFPNICNEINTFSNGCLGSHNDEERSEMRYVMRIAISSESSKFWTHLALPLREYVCWSVCSSPRKHSFVCLFSSRSQLTVVNLDDIILWINTTSSAQNLFLLGRRDVKLNCW
jgi:hypothetical protein